MSQFDRVVALSVEGMSKAAIARIEGLAWNTVSRSQSVVVRKLFMHDIFTTRSPPHGLYLRARVEPSITGARRN